MLAVGSEAKRPVRAQGEGAAEQGRQAGDHAVLHCCMGHTELGADIEPPCAEPCNAPRHTVRVGRPPPHDLRVEAVRLVPPKVVEQPLLLDEHPLAVRNVELHAGPIGLRRSPDPSPPARRRCRGRSRELGRSAWPRGRSSPGGRRSATRSRRNAGPSSPGTRGRTRVRDRPRSRTFRPSPSARWSYPSISRTSMSPGGSAVIASTAFSCARVPGSRRSRTPACRRPRPAGRRRRTRCDRPGTA